MVGQPGGSRSPHCSLSPALRFGKVNYNTALNLLISLSRFVGGCFTRRTSADNSVFEYSI